MTVTELIARSQIKERIHDQISGSYSNDELISYINDGINMVWNHLGNLGYYEVIGDKTFVTASEPLPSDFLKFVASYPIIVKANGTAETYGALPQVTRYIKRAKFVNSVGDNMPFNNDALNNLIGQIVIMLALNKHEFEVGFEKILIDELRQIMG